MDTLQLQSDKSDPAASNGNINQAIISSYHFEMSESHHIIVNQDDRDLTSKNSASTSKNVQKMCHFIFLAMFFVFCFLPLFCVILPLALAIWAVLMALFFSSLTIFGLASMLFSFFFLIILRIFQFISHGDNFGKVAQFKHAVHWVLLISPELVLLGLGTTVYPLVRYVPHLKQVMLLQLPLTKWVAIVSIICGLCMFNNLLTSIIDKIAAQILQGSSRFDVGHAISEIVDSLFFWWMTHEVIRRVPSFKHHEILGLSTQMWIKVSVLLLIGYNLITLFTRLIVFLLRSICQTSSQIATDDPSAWELILKHYLLRIRYVVYYARGMTVSISFMMSSLLLLLTWILYFGPHLNMKSANAKNIWEYGKWTLITLITCSFLWLIKNAVLLIWEAHTVYDRLQPQILSTREQLYFLGLLGFDDHDVLRIRPNIAEHLKQKALAKRKNSKQNCCTKFAFCILEFLQMVNLDEDITLMDKRKEVHNNLFIQKRREPTVDDLQRVSQYFFAAKQELLKEAYISDILKNFKPTDDSRKKLKELILREELDDGTLNPENLHDEQNVVESSPKETRGSHGKKENLPSKLELWNKMVRKRVPIISGVDVNHENEQDEIQREAQMSNQNLRGNDNFEAKNREIEQAKRVAGCSYGTSLPPINAEIMKSEQEGVAQNFLQDQIRGSDNVEADIKEDELELPIEESSTKNETDSHGNEEKLQDEQSKNSSSSNGQWSNDWELFVNELTAINPEIKDTNSEIFYSDIQTWVERAHNQCVNLANTLSSAKEVADCLNKIISWLLIGAIFIMWLLLTGLATTKVLVLIASPLLAATFIFGDTCKTIFQGIIYVFVVHPFDVGDLCIIEEKMLEVRSIGVWTITFTKVDKFGTAQEQVIYSTSELINKIIINHKTKFDWSDRVEFNLGPVKKKICEKKNEIIKFFMDYLKFDEEEEIRPKTNKEEGNSLKPSKEDENAFKADKGEEIHLKSGNEEENVIIPGKEETNVLKPDERGENSLKHDEEKENKLKPDIVENQLKDRKWSTFLSRSPKLSVSAKEDSITLLILLEYKAKDTDKWRYSECLRRKDDLRGEFHLYVQDVISIFKDKFAEPEIKELHSST